MSHKLELVAFHGDNIPALRDGETVRVAIRPVCGALGLDYSGQRQRLERQPWATVGMTTTVGADGKARDMLTADRRTFTMWLATIDTSRLKNREAADRITLYQTEAADALDAYFHQGAAINPRADEHQINAAIRQAQMQMELCQAAKGLIHPDHLEAQARVILARGMGEAPQPITGPGRLLYTSDFLKSKNLSAARTKSVVGMFGKRVKQAYINLHGREPGRYPLTLPNGQTREVYAYTEADRPLMDQVWDEFYATQGVLA